MVVLFQSQQRAFIGVEIDEARFREVQAEFREKFAPLVAAAAPIATADDRQLVESEEAHQLADAKVCEIEARRRTAEIEGDAKKLVAITRELAAAQSAAVEAEEVAIAARQIYASRVAAALANATESRNQSAAKMKALLTSERKRLEAALAGDTSEMLAQLAAIVNMEDRSLIGGDYVALRAFVAER